MVGNVDATIAPGIVKVMSDNLVLCDLEKFQVN